MLEKIVAEGNLTSGSVFQVHSEYKSRDLEKLHKE